MSLSWSKYEYWNKCIHILRVLFHTQQIMRKCSAGCPILCSMKTVAVIRQITQASVPTTPPRREFFWHSIFPPTQFYKNFPQMRGRVSSLQRNLYFEVWPVFFKESPSSRRTIRSKFSTDQPVSPSDQPAYPVSKDIRTGSVWQDPASGFCTSWTRSSSWPGSTRPLSG